MSQPSTFVPHHEFYTALGRYVVQLRIRDKRNIYIAMRKTQGVQTDSFLPHFGIFIADFTVWQILNDRPRRVAPGECPKRQRLSKTTALARK